MGESKNLRVKEEQGISRKIKEDLKILKKEKIKTTLIEQFKKKGGNE